MGACHTCADVSFMNHEDTLTTNPAPITFSKLNDVVKHHVLSVYRSCQDDKRETSKQLGISLLLLYRLFDGWGVLSDEFKREWQDHTGLSDACRCLVRSHKDI